MRLFVYGTLQDPRRLQAVVGKHLRPRAIGPATVRGILYDVGDYPALRPSESPMDAVTGLLLEIEDESLAALDRYEGVDTGLYVRERIEVGVDAGAVQTAWVYIYNRPVSGLRRIGAWPPSGREEC